MVMFAYETARCSMIVLMEIVVESSSSISLKLSCCQEPRPQIPTDVTSMLKYGTNLLQVVGQFNGLLVHSHLHLNCQGYVV